MAAESVELEGALNRLAVDGLLVAVAGSGSKTRLGGTSGCLFGGALGGATGVVTGVILDYVVLAAVDDEATPVMLTFGRSF